MVTALRSINLPTDGIFNVEFLYFKDSALVYFDFRVGDLLNGTGGCSANSLPIHFLTSSILRFDEGTAFWNVIGNFLFA
jgi:hypothetical protein